MKSAITPYINLDIGDARTLLINVLNSLAVLFFAVLFVWLPGCSALTEQAISTHRHAGETKGPDTNENVDSAITTGVKAAIYGEQALKDEEIGVETNQGTVRLTGAVSSILVMKKAIEIARQVKGVREVEDKMLFRSQH